MGRYITKTDLVNEMPVAIQALTTDDTVGGDTEVDAILNAKIDSAEALFESYISHRYTIPYLLDDDTAPQIVQQICLTLTKYLLYSRRNALTPDIQAQYDSTIGFLTEVAKGNANLPLITDDGTLEDSGNPEYIVSEKKDAKFEDFV